MTDELMIQWEGELREGCRYPTEEEIRDELGMSEEDEKAHLEFVKEVAANHGFPISDWTPKLPPAV